MKPWERPFVWVSWQRYIPFKLETDRVYFNPQVKDHQGEDEFDCGQYLHGFEHFFVKFKIAAGKTFPGLCVDVFGIEKPDFNSIVKS